MTIKSINDEIRKVEGILKEIISLYNIEFYEGRLQALKEVRELVEKIQDNEYEYDKDALINEILGED